MEKYIYGIVRAPAPADLPHEGVGGPVTSVQASGIAALVSDVEEVPVVADRRNLMLHSMVLEEVLKGATVLPMRFGTVVRDESAVRAEILESRVEMWSALLDRMEGLVELSLKGFYREEVVLREIVDERAAVRQMRERAQHSYLDSIYLGEAVVAALEDKRTQDVRAISQILDPLAVASRWSEPSAERMVMNAAFLVHRESIGDFDSAVQALGERAGQRIHFKYVGPLPPYSFMDRERQAA